MASEETMNEIMDAEPEMDSVKCEGEYRLCDFCGEPTVILPDKPIYYRGWGPLCEACQLNLNHEASGLGRHSASVLPNAVGHQPPPEPT